MKKFLTILLVLSLSALLITNTKADEASPADNLEEDVKPNEETVQSPDTVEEEWNAIVQKHFSDDSKLHGKEFLLEIAYTHLIYEELDILNSARAKHEAKQEKLTDEEAASLSNALVVKHYIDEKFGDRTEVTNAEALDILNSDKYDTWMDDMPDHVINSLDEFMPDEDEEGVDL